MEESPARNTRSLSRLKKQGQEKDKNPHYRSGSQNTSYQENTDVVNASVDSEAENSEISQGKLRGRHTSRDSIIQGNVSHLHNQLESTHETVTKCNKIDSFVKESDYSTDTVDIRSFTSENLKEVRMRLFEDGDVTADEDQEAAGGGIVSGAVNTDYRTVNSCTNNAWVLDGGVTRLGSMNSNTEKEIAPEGVTVSIASCGLVSEQDSNEITGDKTLVVGTNTDSADTEAESDSESEVFLVPDRDRESKMGDANLNRKMSNNNGKEETDIVVPDNVTNMDIYRMLATFQKQMIGVPAALSNVETAVEDLKLQMIVVEMEKTETNRKVQNVEVGLEDTSSRISVLETANSMRKEELEQHIKVFEENKEKVSKVLKDYKIQIEKLGNVVANQSVLIGELKIQNEMLKARIMSVDCCMTVSGILKKEDENCKELVLKFLEKVMGVDNVGVGKAFCVGDKTDVIMFYLIKPQHKGIIFKNVHKLKDKINPKGEYYTIHEYLTGERNEVYRRVRDALVENYEKQ